MRNPSFSVFLDSADAIQVRALKDHHTISVAAVTLFCDLAQILALRDKLNAHVAAVYADGQDAGERTATAQGDEAAAQVLSGEPVRDPGGMDVDF